MEFDIARIFANDSVRRYSGSELESEGSSVPEGSGRGGAEASYISGQVSRQISRRETRGLRIEQRCGEVYAYIPEESYPDSSTPRHTSRPESNGNYTNRRVRFPSPPNQLSNN